MVPIAALAPLPRRYDLPERHDDVDPFDQADHGRLSVTGGSPLRLTGPEGFRQDVLLFPRDPGLASSGGRHHFLDPLSALWCYPGRELTLRAGAGRTARFDWLAVDPLARRVPEAAGFLRHALSGRIELLIPLPPALYLAQRILGQAVELEIPESPPRAWRPAVSVALHADRPCRIERSGGTCRPGDPIRFDRGEIEDMNGDLDPRELLARRAREYLCRTCSETRPVGRIADDLGCSEGHLSRSFKRWTGLTLLGYRHELRMRAALDRIEDGGDDLAGLACDLGYASHSHFTTRFERTFGLTPSAYRRLARGFGSSRKTAWDSSKTL